MGDNVNRDRLQAFLCDVLILINYTDFSIIPVTGA